MKKITDPEIAIQDSKKNDADWAWYMLFAVFPLSSYLLYLEFMNFVYPELAIGWVGGVLGLLLAIAVKLIHEHYQTKKENNNV